MEYDPSDSSGEFSWSFLFNFYFFCSILGLSYYVKQPVGVMSFILAICFIDIDGSYGSFDWYIERLES
jgi:hypothetical protein